MKVAVIHATTTALQPIQTAFQEVAPEIELLHFMDTGLLPMMEEARGLAPSIMRRFMKLLNLAIESDVQAIQLSCSAFNNVTDIVQPMFPVRLFRSDEAMLDEALQYRKIGMISTVEETPHALSDYLRSKNPDIQIESLVDREAIAQLFRGQVEDHDRRVVAMMQTMLMRDVEALVLSQYSMAHVAAQFHTDIPVLTAPYASARRCAAYVLGKSDS